MTTFLNACGVTDSPKLIVEGPGTNQAELRLLRQPFAIIGRNARADVVLDHVEVSRRHIYLQVVEGRAFWIDLGSRTGTRAGKRIQKLGWLDGRRTLGIGPYELRLSIAASQNTDFSRSSLPRDAPFLVRSYSTAPLPEVALEFLNGPSRSTRWPVHRVMSLLGSASGCKLRLADPSVSRFHASLVRTPAGLWVVDLLGQSGITVNSASVRCSRLEDGDVLEIGRYQIRVQCGWHGQTTRHRSPGSKPLVTLRPPNRELHPLQVPDWTTTAVALGFTPASGSPEGVDIPFVAQPSFTPHGIEVTPSAGAYPVKAGQSDATGSILVPLVNQFGLMQQQMFDQFQQAMAMLVQMFGQMHREQMDVIRAELDRLHELTEEFQSLKDELAKRTQSQPISSGLKGDQAAPDPSAYGQRDVLTGFLSPQTIPFKSQPTAAKPSSGSETVRADSPMSSPLSSQSDAQKDRLSGQARNAPTSDRLLSELNAPPRASDQSQSAGFHSQLGLGDAGSAADADKDTIIWLHQRIMSIQSERESRWQKILKLLPGVS